MDTRTKAFYQSENGKAQHAVLLSMTESEDYNTMKSYTTLDENGLSFVIKHMKYMSQYPNMNHAQYVSNLKLMTKRAK